MNNDVIAVVDINDYEKYPLLEKLSEFSEVIKTVIPVDRELKALECNSIDQNIMVISSNYNFFKFIPEKLSSYNFFIANDDPRQEINAFRLPRHFLAGETTLKDWLKGADQLLHNLISHKNNSFSSTEYVDTLIEKLEVDAEKLKMDNNLLELSNTRLTESITKKKKEINELQQNNIENLSDDKIEDVIKNLSTEYERKYDQAIKIYVMGAMPLVMGVIIITWTYVSQMTTKIDINYTRHIFGFLKSISAILVLGALAKYAYSVAKGLMHESIIISDRIHALKYGMFHLKAFGKDMTMEERKEVFKDWNTTRKDSCFSSQKVREISPEIIEFLKTLKGITSFKEATIEKKVDE